MDRDLIGLCGLVGLFILIMLRIPVALSMLVTGIIGTWALSLTSPFIKFIPYVMQFKTAIWNSVANYELSVVPIFVLMGFLASETGLSRDLFQGLSALTRKIKGGVAMATVMACAGFGAVSGSSIATASTMGRVALPELRKLKYQEGLSTGVLASGGTLGILIPPSVALVIYAIIVEVPIIEMFQAAVIPGFMAVIFFLVVIKIQIIRNPNIAPELMPMSQKEVRSCLYKLIPVLVIFGSIILGLGVGLFTPTPAAAMGLFLVLIHGLLARSFFGKGLTLNGISNALLATAKTAGMIYFILFAADVLKGFFARTGLPLTISELALSSSIEPFLILMAMLLILIVLGCFLESLSMILVVVPFFWPVLVQLNGGDYVTAADATFGMNSYDLKIWFGVLALIVVELGLITPPVGLNVFVIKSFSPQTSIRIIFLGIIPFFISELIRIGIILFFPGLSLFFTRLF